MPEVEKDVESGSSFAQGATTIGTLVLRSIFERVH